MNEKRMQLLSFAIHKHHSQCKIDSTSYLHSEKESANDIATKANSNGHI